MGIFGQAVHDHHQGIRLYRLPVIFRHWLEQSIRDKASQFLGRLEMAVQYESLRNG